MTLEGLFVPVAVNVCVWPASADPVNAGAELVPAGVMDETPPEGLAVVADTTSPDVGARALPPVAVEVITCVPVVAAVVPPCTSYVTVTVCVWLITEVKGVPVNVGAATVPAGVPALLLDVVAPVPEKVWAAAVRVAIVGVIVFEPPVPPTSPFAASVP